MPQQKPPDLDTQGNPIPTTKPPDLDATGNPIIESKPGDIPAPEQPGMLSRAYHWFTDPLTTIPSDIAHTAGDAMTEHTLNENPTWAKIRGFGAGALQGIGDLVSQATSPFSLATAALTGGSSLAAKSGLPAIAQALKYGAAAASAPVAAHGAYGVGRYVFDPSMTTPELANSATELAAGLGGMAGATKFGGPKGTPKEKAVLTDLQRPLAEPVPQIEEAPKGTTDVEAMIKKLGTKGNLETINPEEWTNVNNASGESAASLEAMHRQADMKAKGEQFIVYDKTGQKTPLIGPDAVDYKVKSGETYGVQGPNGFRVLDDLGGKVPPSEKEGFVGAGDAAQIAAASGGENAPDMSDLGTDLAGLASKYPVIWMKHATTSDIIKLTKRGYRVNGPADPVKGLKFELGTSPNAVKAQGIEPSGTPQNPIPAIPQDNGPMNVKGPSMETVQSLAAKGYQAAGVNPDGTIKFEYSKPAEVPKSSSGLAKVGEGFQQTQGFVKSVMASNDLSAIRQAYPSVTYKAFWTSLDDMVKAWGSQKFYDESMKAMRDDPLYQVTAGPNGTVGPSIAEKMGLDITDSLNRREEMYASQFADKYVPGVKRSERAYTLFLNKIRTDNYKALLKSSGALDSTGNIVNEPLAKEMADFVNDATGRGDLGSLEKHAKLLNSMFFSPRLMASRVNILTKPLTYMNMPWEVRKQYLRSLLGVVGVGSAVGELASQAGNAISPGSVQVSHDPTNPDFMKIKIGNTRIDPFYGFQQPVVLAAKALMGQTTSSESGKTRNLYSPNLGEDAFGNPAIHQKSPYDPTMLSTLMNYGRSKLDPTLGFAVSLLDAATEPNGQKMDFKNPNPFNNSIAQRFIPMVMQDIYSIANDDPTLLPLLAPAVILGTGSQTYGGKQNVAK